MSWMNELFNDAAKAGESPQQALLRALNDISLSEQQKKALTEVLHFNSRLSQTDMVDEVKDLLQELDAMKTSTRRNIVDYLEAYYASVSYRQLKGDEQKLIDANRKFDGPPSERRGESGRMILKYIVKEKAEAVHPYITEFLKADAALPPEQKGTLSGLLTAQLKATIAAQKKMKPNGPNAHGSSPPRFPK